MTNEELNKHIHEILGMCWHEFKSYKNIVINYCVLCKTKNVTKLDFTISWEGFGILITWWMKHKDWEKFPVWVLSKYDEEQAIPVRYLSPSALAEATVEFFEEAK